MIFSSAIDICLVDFDIVAFEVCKYIASALSCIKVISFARAIEKARSAFLFGSKQPFAKVSVLFYYSNKFIQRVERAIVVYGI